MYRSLLYTEIKAVLVVSGLWVISIPHQKHMPAITGQSLSHLIRTYTHDETAFKNAINILRCRGMCEWSLGHAQE